MVKLAQPYNVIVDTREKCPYVFKAYDNCTGMVKKKLDTGDYSIEGLEHVVCIERKASLEEIANNLTEGTDRLEREMQRMRLYEQRFIVCEFSMQDVIDYPNSSKLPDYIKKKIKLNGKYLLKKLMEFQVNYHINVIFCGDKEGGFYFVASLLKRLSEKYL
jgi:ERCC4-type nuclease